jgi:hypothetical protein
MLSVTAAQLADRLMAQHERWFAKNPMGELVQTVLMEGEDGEVNFVPCPWQDAAERVFVLEALRVMMLAKGVVRYAIWSEVWIKHVTPPPGSTAEKDAERFARSYRHGDIAEDPDRTEAVFTLVVEPGGKLTTRLQRIERGRAGGVRRLVLEEGGEDLGQLGGALADLMPERSVH